MNINGLYTVGAAIGLAALFSFGTWMYQSGKSAEHARAIELEQKDAESVRKQQADNANRAVNGDVIDRLRDDNAVFLYALPTD